MISIVIQIFEYEKGSGDRLYLEHGLFSFYRKFLDYQYVVGVSKNREAVVATESPIPFFML